MQIKSINVTGQYQIDNKVLTPESTNDSKPLSCLLICPSKYKGRQDYLAAKIIGSYKPEFISTIYEPRTDEGWFNFELKGVRYEVTKPNQGRVKIYEYNSSRKGVTYEQH